MENEITKGKRKRVRRRLSALEALHESGHTDYSAPAFAQAEGYCDAMKPDETKSMLGEPPANPLRYALAYAQEQAAKGAADMAGPAERARGGNPVSVQDYNSQRAGSSRRVAAGHQDLQQQPATVFQGVLASLRANPYNFVGGTGFNGVFGATDRPVEAPGDQVQVRGFDAAGSAGSYAGMQPVDIAPRGDDGYHQHRDSAAAPNGSHNLGNVTSRAVASKASDRLQVMKDTMRRI